MKRPLAHLSDSQGSPVMHHPERRPARRPHLLGNLTRLARSCSPFSAALSHCRKGLGALGLGLALVQGVLIASAFNVKRVRRTALVPG